MRTRTLAAALLLLCCAAAQAAAQTTPAQTPAPTPTPQTPAAKPAATPDEKPSDRSDAKKKYEALLEKAKKGEGEVDYRALRFAYFETPEYNPLAGMLDYRALWSQVMRGDWPEAAKQAEAVLAKNFVDANAHMVAHIAYREQGDAERAQLHRHWADGLIASIKAGGDGKSPDTAWHVISISEEYAVLRSLNLRAMGQSLINSNGHAYDALKTVDRQNAEATYFFNVDRPFSAYGRK